MEGETTINLFDTDPQRLDLDFKMDYVYTNNRDTGEPLPFVPPFRFGTGLSYYWRMFGADVSLLWARKQTSVPVGELPTDGYTMVNANANYQFTTGMATVNLFVRGFNLLNQDARVSSSVLKDVAPLPGVGALGGFRVSF
jgi:iron complex outermembrane receptor protein